MATKMSQKKESVWTKGQPKKRLLRKLPQVPGTRIDEARDRARKARRPGLRRSRAGNLYWETRENRSYNKDHPDPTKRML